MTDNLVPPMAVYQIDTQIQLSVNFVDLETGALVDPSNISVIVQTPTGTTSTFTYGSAGGAIARQAVGIYTYTFAPTISGVWTYKWQGDQPPAGGPVIATSPDRQFLVQPSIVLPG
jgi:hypothetical protein